MKTVMTFLAALGIIGCSVSEITIPTLPPDTPIDQLRAAPETIVVQGKTLSLSTYLWRDFMPISPPDGKPLNTIIYVTATDAAELATPISADAVWVIYNNEVWKAWLTIRPNAEGGTNQKNLIVGIASNGPKWGPHVFVDVVVRVSDGKGGTMLLRAPHQGINRTD